MTTQGTPATGSYAPEARRHAAAIQDPVSVAILASNAWDASHMIMGAFEHKCFPPDTPANDQYQFIVDMSWEKTCIAVAIFPQARLPELRDIVAAWGMHLLEGAPKAVTAGGLSTYDVNATLRRELGIGVGERTYVLHTSGFFTPIEIKTFSL